MNEDLFDATVSIVAAILLAADKVYVPEAPATFEDAVRQAQRLVRTAVAAE